MVSVKVIINMYKNFVFFKESDTFKRNSNLSKLKFLRKVIVTQDHLITISWMLKAVHV